MWILVRIKAAQGFQTAAIVVSNFFINTLGIVLWIKLVLQSVLQQVWM